LIDPALEKVGGGGSIDPPDPVLPRFMVCRYIFNQAGFLMTVLLLVFVLRDLELGRTLRCDFPKIFRPI